MATSNFSRTVNASRYFTVNGDSWEYQNLIENLTDQLEEMASNHRLTFYPEDKWNGNYERVIGTLCGVKIYGDIGVEVGVEVHLESGYYEGVKMDYRIMVQRNKYGEISEVDEEDTVEILLEELFDTDTEYMSESNMNLGMRVIQRNRAVKWVHKEIERISEIVEEVLSLNSDQELRLVGTFSNGESIYEEI